MTPKSKLFQAGFSAALAIAFLVLASPVRSETIDLTCALTGEGNVTIRLLIDTDRRAVTEISVGAFGPSTSDPLTATISDQFIKYSGPLPGNNAYSCEGTLDRIAGTLNRTIRGGNYFSQQSFACRRATQKF